jgi:hypothetical protein
MLDKEVEAVGCRDTALWLSAARLDLIFVAIAENLICVCNLGTRALSKNCFMQQGRGLFKLDLIAE